MTTFKDSSRIDCANRCYDQTQHIYPQCSGFEYAEGECKIFGIFPPDIDDGTMDIAWPMSCADSAKLVKSEWSHISMRSTQLTHPVLSIAQMTPVCTQGAIVATFITQSLDYKAAKSFISSYAFNSYYRHR